MSEPKDGPWRQNPAYLKWRNPLTDSQVLVGSAELSSLDTLPSFPQEIDWIHPSKEQEAWSKHILEHCSDSALDIFQEYGLIRKQWAVTKLGDYEASRKIALAVDMAGRNGKATYSRLYPIFGQEFADFHRILGYTWKYFLYAKQNEHGAYVEGGGKMHVGDMGRTYWSGLQIQFDSTKEANLFLDTVKAHPRPALELYLRTLFGDVFPSDHYDGRRLGGSDRVVFYPFDEIHGPLEVATKDLTATA